MNIHLRKFSQVYRRDYLSGHLLRYATRSGLYDERAENLLSCRLCTQYRTALGECLESMDIEVCESIAMGTFDIYV